MMAGFKGRVVLLALALTAATLAVGARARASEVEELYRSPRLLAMGGAGLALVEDEEALFLNPAGLSSVEGIDLHAAVLDLELSSDLISKYLDGELVAPTEIEDYLSLLMNKRVSFRGSLSPTLLVEGLGFGVLGDQRVALRITNEVLPRIELQFQQTYGYQLGYGFRLRNPFGARGRRNPELSFGIGYKRLTRRGGFRTIETLDAFSLNQEKVLELAGDWGSGSALDLGVQFSAWLNDVLKLHAGASLQNLGGLDFSGGDADPLAESTSFGVALTRPFKASSLFFACDFRHAFEELDWRKKSHLGIGVRTPAFGLSAGLNQGYFTYGGYVDVWLLRLSGAATTEETGALLYQNPEPRWSARVDLKLDL